MKVGDAEATDLHSFVDLIRKTRPGSELALHIERDGKQQDITVKVGVLPFRFLD